MRNAIILGVSLIILLTAGIWQIRYIEESAIYAISDVEYATNLIKNNDFERASTHIDKLENTWTNMSTIWNIFIVHNEIDDIREILVNFKMYTKLEDKVESLVYSEQLIQNLQHVINKQKVKMENVF